MYLQRERGGGVNLRGDGPIEIIIKQEMEKIIKIKWMSTVSRQMMPPIDNFLHDLLCLRQRAVKLVLVQNQESPELIGHHVGPTIRELGKNLFHVFGWLSLRDLELSVKKIKHLVIIAPHFIFVAVARFWWRKWSTLVFLVAPHCLVISVTLSGFCFLFGWKIWGREGERERLGRAYKTGEFEALSLVGEGRLWKQTYQMVVWLLLLLLLLH